MSKRGPETIEKRKIALWLTRIGAWHYHVPAAFYSTSGIPDRCGVFRRRGFGIEVKAPRDKGGREPTRLQQLQLQACADAGGLAVVAYCLADVQRAFAEAFNDPTLAG